MENKSNYKAPERPCRNFRLNQTAYYSLTGASDHGVSEALYLDDPDGNGVQLYWDRPKEEWPKNPDGSLTMFTRPLDPGSLLKELEQNNRQQRRSYPSEKDNLTKYRADARWTMTTNKRRTELPFKFMRSDTYPILKPLYANR